VQKLSRFVLIGVATSAWMAIVLSITATPSYNDYLIPVGQYQQLMMTGVVADFMISLEPFVMPLGFAIYAWLWFNIAGYLNPATKTLRFAADRDALWTWVAWIVSGLLLLVSFALVYNPVAGTMGGHRLQMIRWAVAVFAAIGSWTILSPQAFGRFGNKSLPPFSWRSVASTAAHGAAFIVLFGLVAKVMDIGFMTWATVMAEGLDRYSEASKSGWYGIITGMTVLVTLCYATVFGLLPAFVPGTGSLRTRMANVRPALLLSAAVAVAALVSLPILNSVNYLGSKTLKQAADFSGIQPQSLQLVKLCQDRGCRVKGDKSVNPVLAVGKPHDSVMAYGMMMIGGGPVPLHADTVKKLEQFVHEHRFSVLRKAAMLGASDVYLQLWQRADAAQLWNQFVSQGELKDATLFWTQMQLVWLMNASPINLDTRALLESMSDDKQYRIGAYAALRLAATWARFGDMDKANAFLAQARQANPGKFDYVKLAPADLANGQVRGKLVLPAGTTGVRVGLFRVNPDPTRKSDSTWDSGSSLVGNNPAIRLTGSAVLSADGSFVFDGLGSGDYYLGLLVPQDKLGGRHAVVGRHVPDRITLNKASSRRDLGVIKLTPQ